MNRILLSILAAAALAGPAGGAVFDMVVNVPPAVIGQDEKIGNAGQTVQLNILSGGGVPRNLYVYSGTEVNLFDGGELGTGFRAYEDSVVNITGGTAGNGFDARLGSVVNITGGTVGNNADSRGGSVVNITGGTVGDNFEVRGFVTISGGEVTGLEALGGTVNITGGEVTDLDTFSGGTVNISGGSVGTLNAQSGSAVNLFAIAFVLDGQPLDLTPNAPYTLTDRGVTLEGTWADGTTFSFDLNPTDADDSTDYFDPDATLTLTVIPEPTSLALLGMGGLLAATRRRRSGLSTQA